MEHMGLSNTQFSENLVHFFFQMKKKAWASVGMGKDYTSHVLGDQLGNCKALHTKRLQARKVSNAERSMSCHHDAAFLGTAMVI